MTFLNGRISLNGPLFPEQHQDACKQHHRHRKPALRSECAAVQDIPSFRHGAFEDRTLRRAAADTQSPEIPLHQIPDAVKGADAPDAASFDKIKRREHAKQSQIQKCQYADPVIEQMQRADNIKRFENISVPVGYVDVSLYRDDLTEISPLPDASGCEFPEDVRDKTVILVDDVIYTGRTVRAAIEAIFAKGRPKAIQLAVLIDRGHRELPIKPDYIGKNVPTSHNEIVCVEVSEYDGENRVMLGEN